MCVHLIEAQSNHIKVITHDCKLKRANEMFYKYYYSIENINYVFGIYTFSFEM